MTRTYPRSGSDAGETTQDPDQGLRLSSQYCFPLYTLSRFITQAYKPHLDPLGLTYPQYLVMLVLWEEDRLSNTQIGIQLCLDSATLTQVLKKLASSGLIERHRPPGDARTVINQLTPQGDRLRVAARAVPIALTAAFAAEVGGMVAAKPAIDKLLVQMQRRMHELREQGAL